MQRQIPLVFPIPIGRSDADTCVCPDFDSNLAQLTYKEAKETMLTRFNHNYIGAMLSMPQGNVTHAAKRCAMDRQALQLIMKRYDIDPDKFRGKSS